LVPAHYLGLGTEPTQITNGSESEIQESGHEKYGNELQIEQFLHWDVVRGCYHRSIASILLIFELLVVQNYLFLKKKKART